MGIEIQIVAKCDDCGKTVVFQYDMNDNPGKASQVLWNQTKLAMERAKVQYGWVFSDIAGGYTHCAECAAQLRVLVGG